MSKEKDVARPSDEEGEKLTRMMVIAPAHLVREHDIRTGAKKGRRFKRLPRDEDPTRTWAEQVVGEITESEYKKALAERAGYELPVEEGVRPLEASCKACGKIFVVPKEVRGSSIIKCVNCRFPKCSECGQEMEKLNTFTPRRIKARGGKPPMCKRCWSRSVNAAMTPEQRSERGWKAIAAMTPEQRSERSRKMNAAKTPEQRSEQSRKAIAAMTPEQRSERVRKAWETKRANAKKAKEEGE